MTSITPKYYGTNSANLLRITSYNGDMYHSNNQFKIVFCVPDRQHLYNMYNIYNKPTECRPAEVKAD